MNGHSYAGYARAFAIFAEYAPDTTYGVHPAHDEITAGPDPGIVSAEHLEELEALGWTEDSESGTCFHKFT
jgi:hypothetical protein